ncbi:hypothetical protein QYF36_011193 [Acer negundo]|nr:hypothetical protein QYF36_011193 [Acer negundo]
MLAVLVGSVSLKASQIMLLAMFLFVEIIACWHQMAGDCPSRRPHLRSSDNYRSNGINSVKRYLSSHDDKNNLVSSDLRGDLMHSCKWRFGLLLVITSIFGYGSGTSRNHTNAIAHSLLEASEILNAAL